MVPVLSQERGKSNSHSLASQFISFLPIPDCISIQNQDVTSSIIENGQSEDYVSKTTIYFFLFVFIEKIDYS